MALSQDILLEELQKLAVQREAGAISGEEFERHAAALLSGSASPTGSPPRDRSLSAAPQSAVETPSTRRAPSWTATPTSVPTAIAPRTVSPQPTTPEPPDPTAGAAVHRPSRTGRSAWSAAPTPGTTPNYSAPAGNLWSDVPGPVQPAAAPAPEPDDTQRPARNGQVRKSSWAAKPETVTDEVPAPAARGRSRRRSGRSVEIAPASPSVSSETPTRPPDREGDGVSGVVPGAGLEPRSRSGILAERPTSAFAAVPAALPEPAASSDPEAPPVKKPKQSRRRFGRRDTRSMPSIEALVEAPALDTVVPESDSRRRETTSVATEVSAQTEPPFVSTDDRRLWGRSSFAAKPETRADSSALEDAVPETKLPLIAALEAAPGVSPDVVAEADLQVETSFEEPQPAAEVTPLEVPAASAWVVEPEPVIEIPPDPIAPVGQRLGQERAEPTDIERRSRGRHRKTGKHAKTRRRREEHASVTASEQPLLEDDLPVLDVVIPDAGSLPKSYWDHSRRILPELRPVGEGDDGHRVDFSYWDLSERELAPLPESDDQPELDRQGYWSRSIKD